MKNRLYLLLIILIILTISFFSSMNWKDTNSISKGIIMKGIDIVEYITHKSYDRKLIVKKLNYPIRKCAHFILFFLLGLCICGFIRTINVPHKIILNIIICLLFAICDETHQLFTSGRTPLVTDVLIDLSGSVLGILLIFTNNSKKGEKE